ncbi:hypothetical protein LCGC14_3168230, partial [marine sediment metagenome]
YLSKNNHLCISTSRVMKSIDLKNNLNVAKTILEGVTIPGKGDSMLAAAKLEHVERVGILLNNELVDTNLSQNEINDVVSDFKIKYSDTFLKYIKKEG